MRLIRAVTLLALVFAINDSIAMQHKIGTDYNKFDKPFLADNRKHKSTNKRKRIEENGDNENPAKLQKLGDKHKEKISKLPERHNKISDKKFAELLLAANKEYSKLLLATHKKYSEYLLHIEKKYTCPECSKTYNHYGYFKIHLNTHNKQMDPTLNNATESKTPYFGLPYNRTTSNPQPPTSTNAYPNSIDFTTRTPQPQRATKMVSPVILGSE